MVGWGPARSITDQPFAINRLKGALAGDGAGQRVAGGREGHEKRVSRLLDLASALPLELAPQQPVVTGQRLPEGLLAALPARRGAFDVRQEEGHGARGKGGSRRGGEGARSGSGPRRPLS